MALLREVEWQAAEESDLFTLSEIASRMGDTAVDPTAMGVLYDALKASMSDEDWPRFRLWAKGQRPSLSVDEMLALAGDLMREVTDRPSQTSSDTPSGQTSTGPSSEDVSSSPVTAPPTDHRHLGLVPVEESAAYRSALAQGRHRRSA